MAKYYSVASLSERISKTPQGFLICRDVPIARSGDLLYSPDEVPVTPGSGNTVISRTVQDIHNPDTVASFEGMPVTLDHPEDFVNAKNWRSVAVGNVQNVRPGDGDNSDKLMADLFIKDTDAIDAVLKKGRREVSCGYEAEHVEIKPGMGRQENIRGNHVALVAAGRCGSECAIFDHAPRKETKMSLKDKVMALIGGAFDQATATGEPAAPVMSKEVLDRIAALEAKAKVADTEAAPDAAMPTLEQRLALIEQAIVKLAKVEEPAKADAAVADSAMCRDADTIARAEIIAPGIAKTADVKGKALTAAYATTDGRRIIDTLLNGKELAKTDPEMLFVAVSELFRATRQNTLNKSAAFDSSPVKKAIGMTPDEVNARNAARFGKAN